MTNIHWLDQLDDTIAIHLYKYFSFSRFHHSGAPFNNKQTNTQTIQFKSKFFFFNFFVFFFFLDLFPSYSFDHRRRQVLFPGCLLLYLIQRNSWGVNERRKHVREGLRYMYVCTCIALPVGYVHCVSIYLQREFLCTRERARATKSKERFEISENILYSSNIIL